ncbi:MAG: hydrogenase expression/formation protein HypE [Bdellovibrionales bacterium]|nr:hydrogenase expression/formation protein HypE [Bdellovibrionales bacterium]
MDKSFECPLPDPEQDKILLGHGGGGQLTHELLHDDILPRIGSPLNNHDGAGISIGSTRYYFTTDSYVVSPWRFPGGDIGKLAVYGTVNDLAMCGAEAKALSIAFILEEGFSRAAFREILSSMQYAAAECRLDIVTGDTKVVERGKGDGIYVNSTGVGESRLTTAIDHTRVEPGDQIIVSGDIGRHGLTIMATREGLSFESELQSDCKSLWPEVSSLLARDIGIHFLRDLTRGGLATALVDIAEESGYDIAVTEELIPISAEVRGACELLGLDALTAACEGRFVAIVPAREASRTLECLGDAASVIGEVQNKKQKTLRLKTATGIFRRLHRLQGELLPRIC